ncbi:MAG: class I SAM-dependent methyltransferase [Pedosphaera sp.]|nr:class I SAM-dependent methyltransferase [Pedosphaera sp.]
MSPIHEQNRRAWDDRVRRRDWYIDTARESDFKHPLAVVDQCGWLGGDVTGRRLLCLAAGGGRHGPLFASAGARVTVVDISPATLALDRQVAAERGLELRLIEASMDDLSMIDPGSFDIVVQPVSTCYVPDVARVYREVARVLVEGGIYVSQHKQPVSLQAEAHPSGRSYVMVEPYYRNGALPPATQGFWHREAGTVEFLHRWEQLLGGLCKSDFVIEDIAEPRHADPQSEPGTFGHRSCYVPPYIKIKARRVPIRTSLASNLWVP